MPVERIRPQRLYQQVAAQIERLVRAGEFAATTQLPTERELASRLGVSRTTVREAMIALEMVGVVEVRGGAGVFVSALPNVLPLLERMEGEAAHGPFELIQARRAFEGEAAAMAATTVADEELDLMARTLADMRREFAEEGTTEHADRRFHLQVAAASRNSVVESVVEALWAWRRGAMWRRLLDRVRTPEMMETGLGEHDAILEALQRRDAEGARQAMWRHLDRVAEALLAADLGCSPRNAGATGARSRIPRAVKATGS